VRLRSRGAFERDVPRVAEALWAWHRGRAGLDRGPAHLSLQPCRPAEAWRERSAGSWLRDQADGHRR
jgi:hypothetical protein